MSKRPFILRIQTSQGTWRAEFDSGSATFSDLKQKIFEKYFVLPSEQVLSYDPPSRPKFVEGSDSDTLSGDKLKFVHGLKLFLVLTDVHVSEYKRRLSEIEAKSAEEKSADGSSIRSPKGAGTVVISDSSISRSTVGKLTTLTKRKGPTSMSLTSDSFVAKIKADEEEKKKRGPKHAPFHEWIAERQKKLAHTPWLIDPPTYDYKAVKRTSHMRFADLPSNAVINRQEYRHCDVVRVMDMAALAKFKAEWEKDPSVQRGAYLIGKYTKGPSLDPDDSSEEEKTMIYADVYTVYVPPQRGSSKGVSFIPDPNQKTLDSVIEACGLQRVGWMVTTLPRGGEEYKGDIFMSGKEIVTASRLQTNYKNSNTGFSQFCTLVVHISTKAPEAYMISDQGVSMVRGGLIGPTDDPGFMSVRDPPADHILPSVISEMKEIRAGEKFLPDALLVNLISTQPTKPKPLFKLAHFPAKGTVEKLREHMTYYRESPKHRALSDFNLLVFLAQVMHVDLVCQLIYFVMQEQVIPDELDRRFNEQMRLLSA